MNYIVTSYVDPDLDGTASMYAYSEFLRKSGKNSNFYIEGKPMPEAEIVCDMFQIDLKPAIKIEKEDRIIVTDTNFLVTIPFVNPENIVEFIDHHKITESQEICQNAKFQIEMVGAACTLIAERFWKSQVEISRESAILLYYGIISNTINLKAKVTTKRDLEMAKWLKEKCSEITDEKVKEIFMKKSQIRDSLRAEMEAEIVWNVKGKRLTIAQLEYANVEEFLVENETKIREILQEVKRENQLDYVLINCVDTLNGYSVILVIDEKTEELIADLLNIKFIQKKAKTDELILRKEIFYLLEK